MLADRCPVLTWVLLACLGGIAALAACAASPAPPILAVPKGAEGARVETFVTVTNQPAPVRTTAVVSWDDRALTVVFTCEDAQIVATPRKRDDPDMWRDDCVEIFLDPGHTHHALRSWFHVLVSAAGSIVDDQGPVTAWYSTGDVESGNRRFTARGLTAVVTRTPEGWQARIRIPWQDIGARPTVGDAWGMNLHRTDHPDESYLCYAPTFGSFYRFAQWGHLAFADADGGLGGSTRAQLAARIAREHAALATQFLTFGGVTYAAVDPGAPFTPAPLPAQRWRTPAPRCAERNAGLQAFVPADPGDYTPTRCPHPAEQISALHTFLTPGEDEAVWFGVFALDDLRHLTVRVETGDAPVSVDVRHLHCWPQRTGWRSRQWYLTPELLLPWREGMMTVPTTRGLLEDRPFDLQTGTTAACWLTLTAAPDAPPGRYEATVTIGGRDREALVLPLHIEVLPFTLQRPTDRHWTLYSDSWRWQQMTDAQILAELRDFARHGITGLNSINLGQADLSRLSEGTVTFDAAYYRRITALAPRAGRPGPHVIQAFYAQAVRDIVAPGVDLRQGPWPQAVSDGVAAVARAAVAATRDLPAWYFYGLDEPTGDNTYAIQDYQAWHAGGARTYATVANAEFFARAGEYLTAPCFVSGLIARKDDNARMRAACATRGAEFWWYGIGCYANPFPQEGRMGNNRYGAGLFFWKSGAVAQGIWTYCRPFEDAFNDMDGARGNRIEPKDACLVYPHFLAPDDWRTYQGAIPTIAWEAIREGADDYAYLYTLTRMIADARRHPDPARRRQAQRAERRLNALVDSIPWANTMDAPTFDTRRLQQVRRSVADEIVRLSVDAPPD
jgi:hypothetical protein